MKNEVKKRLNIIELVKMIKSNNRYKAMFILGLYIIFFTIVILVFNPSNYKKTPIKKETPMDVLEQYKSLSNYNFKYQISYTDYEKIITDEFNGEFKDGIFNFTDIIGNKYYLENDILYQNDELKEELDNEVILNTFKYTPNLIYGLIKQSTLESKTEIYSDKTMNKSYRLNINKTLDNGEIIDAYVLISTIEDNKSIKEATISFESLDKTAIIIGHLKTIKISYIELDM